MKTLIVIDLDVVTVHLWKGSQAKEAAEFIKKVESKCFDIIVPYTLLELAKNWQYTGLKEKITAFYRKYAVEVNAADVEKKLGSSGINDKELVISLVACGVKEEDAALVMTASLFKADYLVTFNRKHLRSKEAKICEVLSGMGIPEIKICSPSELLKEAQNED